MELLERLYYDPEQGFCGELKLYKRAHAIDPNIKHKDVKQFLSKQELSQVFAPKMRLLSYPIYSAVPNSYQADLIFLPKDNGYHIVLTIININTRKAYAYACQTKSATEMHQCLKHFLSKHDVSIITTDNGKEFLNKMVLKLFKDKDVEHYINFAGDHRTMGMIERFNRTIKLMLKKYLSYNKTTSWMSILPRILHNYNTSHHSSIGMAPNDVTPEIEQQLIWQSIQKTCRVKKEEKLEDGCTVRVALDKKQFEKEGKRWSDQLGKIVGVHGNK
jgi:hypothetical protein